MSEATQAPTVYEAAGGADAIRRLAEAWHARCLADPIAEHPFSHGTHPQHTERLAAYWGEMLGGPPAFTSGLGTEADVVRMHSGNGPHPELDTAAECCFVKALDDAQIPDEEPLRTNLIDWFRWSSSLVNHGFRKDEVDDGLRLPKWTWGGPVE
ncbi:group II truncated hemoglobin [Microlunatus sp. Gsoil 973]|jgi:hemoglobin|uniref:group II truncated hemoglobin n=1 Tax=Microlunatus sp. Gsoil 973 TaxID=2672569 RepID=UPI0012B4DDE9|nr:group II truncated hemoglobin [Microlunatus sp. Gsoil 973]QGN34224.1 oxidoreductase [Microlunatus sp. Gsoil 973]